MARPFATRGGSFPAVPQLYSLSGRLLRSRDDVISLADLWLRCFALGSTNTPQELAGFLLGELRPTSHEYNLVAVALNEYLVDIGASQSVPYIEHAELGGYGRRGLSPMASLYRPCPLVSRANRAVGSERGGRTAGAVSASGRCDENGPWGWRDGCRTEP